MHFQLRITLGNEAMQTCADVGRALIDLGECLHGWNDSDWIGTAGLIKDDNGQTVGSWDLAENGAV